jgi:hypothetical protein
MRVVLDLDPGTTQISGTLTRGPTGDTRASRGTLELLAVLEEILTGVERTPPDRLTRRGTHTSSSQLATGTKPGNPLWPRSGRGRDVHPPAARPLAPASRD